MTWRAVARRARRTQREGRKRPAAADGASGAAKAVTAAAYQSARGVYHLLKFGEAYVKRTEEQYGEEARQRIENLLALRAKEWGYELKTVEAATRGESQP